MNKEDKRDLEPQEDKINDISVQDQIKFKNVGVSIEKKKKIKAGLFWGLSLAGIATVLTIALTVKKPKNEDYKFWKSGILLNKKVQDQYISYDKDKKLDVTIKSFIEELIYNKNWEDSPSLKNLNFKNLKAQFQDLEFHNIIHNTVNNSVCFDCLFINKQNRKIYRVLRNIELKNFLPNSNNDYKVSDYEKQRLNKFEELFLKNKFIFNPKDKYKSLQEHIDMINSEPDIWEKGQLFQQIFLESFKNQKINFFPLEIYNLVYDQLNKQIVITYKPFLLSNDKIKEKGKKYIYWRYFTTPNIDGQIIRTKTIKLI